MKNIVKHPLNNKKHLKAIITQQTIVLLSNLTLPTTFNFKYRKSLKIEKTTRTQINLER